MKITINVDRALNGYMASVIERGPNSSEQTDNVILVETELSDLLEAVGKYALEKYPEKKDQEED